MAAGQIVARLDCRDVEADLAAAEARLQETTAVRQRLLRGGREDARAESEAQVRSADARFANARLVHERASRLFNDDQIIPRSTVDAAERDERVAAADLEAARQHAALIRAEPLAEERAAADATVASAHWLKAALSARLDKCVIRSPIDGVVLRRHLEPGERVVGWSERPIVTVADLSSLRVRIEVDERDVGSVRVGQCVHLTAAALGSDTRSAIVSRVSPTMGRRHVQSGDPSEKADRDILEVIADLVDRDARLISGLRVTAVFLNDGARPTVSLDGSAGPDASAAHRSAVSALACRAVVG